MKRVSYIIKFFIILLTSAFIIYSYLFLPNQHLIYKIMTGLSTVIHYINYIFIGCACFHILFGLFEEDDDTSIGTRAKSTLPVIAPVELIVFFVPYIIENHLWILAITISLILGLLITIGLMVCLESSGVYTGISIWLGITICSFHFLFKIYQDHFITMSFQKVTDFCPLCALVAWGICNYLMIFSSLKDDPEHELRIIPNVVVKTILICLLLTIIQHNNYIQYYFFETVKDTVLPIATILLIIDTFLLEDQTGKVLFLD